MIYFDGYFIGKNEKESGNPYNYFNLNTLQFEDKLEVSQYMVPGLYTKDGIIGTGFSLNPLLLDLDEKVVEELPVDVEIEGTVAIDNRLYFTASNVIPGTSMMGDYSIYSMDLNGEDIQLVIK